MTEFERRFESLLADHELIFINFWAGWCAPCKVFSEIYDKVSKAFPTILFLKIDIEEQKEWVDRLNIRSVPHLMVIKKGLLVYSDAGNIQEETLQRLAQELLQLDIESVFSK